ncbi:hypothetical protein Desor_0973 [Desulfosporosinus orientis DSM 765]|uniref:Uncharacterized protein n=1 Tax=Desulfosporosinus orientis (strain ATCC 19365 / DSM 765 / NCIMB 8382 / VKM B-1628 / Singapore I) TaxID=768706 RepID=G7W5K1_DESOD|nr:hypothetical protein Desor_0973 [Desulfosporosinus orientis DSM 765]
MRAMISILNGIEFYSYLTDIENKTCHYSIAALETPCSRFGASHATREPSSAKS